MELEKRKSIDWYKKFYNRKGYRYLNKTRKMELLAELEEQSFTHEEEETRLEKIQALTELLAGNIDRPSENREFFISHLFSTKVGLDERIIISGKNSIDALRNHYKSIGKDDMIIGKEGSDITITPCSTSHNNGIKTINFYWNSSRKGYSVREKNLFEKLHDLHTI